MSESKRLSLGQRASVLIGGVSSALIGKERASTLMRGISAAFTGQWEGGERNRFRERPGRRLVSQDTDLSNGKREDLLSEARNLCQTFPITKRILSQYANHCIGKLRVKWPTVPREIAMQYQRAWTARMNVIDVKGQHKFPKMTKIALSRYLCDGDFFAQKIQNTLGPQLSLIEADRVSSGGNYNTDQLDAKTGRGIFGGIGVDTVGRPDFYRVWQRSIYGSFQNQEQIRARDMLHVFDTDRADAYRGVTAFHTVLNSLRDLKETINSEVLSGKAHSRMTFLVQSVFGGAATGAVNLFEDTPATTEQAAVKVEDLGEMATQYMFPSENFKAFESNRPSAAWQGLVELVIGLISVGMDLPKSVVWSMLGLGGAPARFEIEQARRTFAATQDVIEDRFIIPVVGWSLAADIQAKRVPFHPDWYQFKIGRPSFISVDAGRDSKAGIAENLAGLMTAQRWFDEEGEDFYEETEQLAIEADFRNQLLAKYPGITLADIRQTTPNGNPAQTADPTTQEDVPTK